MARCQSTSSSAGRCRISLTDHGYSCRRPRHVLQLISQSVLAVYRVSRLWISGDSGQLHCRTSEEEKEESAISSRTSNHRLVRLMELFGKYKRFHLRSRRHRELTWGLVAAGASVAEADGEIEVLARTVSWDQQWSRLHPAADHHDHSHIGTAGECLFTRRS